MRKDRTAQIVIKDVITKIKNHGGIQRLGCMFDTKQQSYFYDSGTGKVECLDKVEANFFNWLFERREEDGFEQWCAYNQGDAAEEILLNIAEVVDKEHLLEAPYPSKMYSEIHQKKLSELLENGVRMITLELTGRCNMRCGYCIYNESFSENRNFSDSDMSIEIAHKAIDYLAQHSGKEVAVTFYGGEPLLCFPLIQDSILYAQSVMPEKKISYSITSNMTLMSKEIAEFFYGIKNFQLVASLDGPQEIHDAYRKYPSGKGSFKDAIRGLKILADVFGEDFVKRVSISTVFAPPYTFERLEKINCFFNSLDWMPQGIQKLFSYPEHGSVSYSLEESDGVEIDEDQDKGYVNTISKWTQAVCEEKGMDLQLLVSKKVYEDILLRIHKRVLTDKASEVSGLNGCCVPGTRRLYVTTDGKFKPCDRIGVCPVIGDVDRGLDQNTIKKLYVEDYIAASKECDNCWAKRMCGICYAKIYSEEKISIEKKKFACDMARHTTQKGLILYHSQLEKDPESLSYLNNILYG